MTISFETKTSVFTENAEHLGDIEEQDGGGWTFTAAVEMPLSADELIQIGEHVKAISDKPRDKVIEDARYIIEAFKRGESASDYLCDIGGWLDELNGVKDD